MFSRSVHIVHPYRPINCTGAEPGVTVSACGDDKDDEDKVTRRHRGGKADLGLAVSTLQTHSSSRCAMRSAAADRLGVELVVKDAGDDPEQQNTQYRS